MLQRCNARRRTGESGSHTSTPCAQIIVLIRGAGSRIACANGARFGCAATTSLARRRAARIAAAVNRALLPSHPVNTNSREPTDMRCNSGPSFKLSSRHSIPRPAANSVITAARWRPAHWIPPLVARSGKSPIITRRVCQLLREKARCEFDLYPLQTPCLREWSALPYDTFLRARQCVAPQSKMMFAWCRPGADSAAHVERRERSETFSAAGCTTCSNSSTRSR
jgi:hypothetical protein